MQPNNQKLYDLLIKVSDLQYSQIQTTLHLAALEHRLSAIKPVETTGEIFGIKTAPHPALHLPHSHKFTARAA